MNDTTIHQAKEVITALQSFVDRIVEIENLIGSKDDYTKDERETLNELLSSIKKDISFAAKRQTVKDNKKQPNEIEINYFVNATSEAELRLLKIKLRTHPIKSNWLYHLDDASSDLQEYIRQLKKLC